jgi:hypothetical protein
MGRRYRQLAVLISLAAVAMVAGTVFGPAALDRYLDPFDDQPFSQASWAAAEAQGRGRMARDAIRRLPVGTPKDRVRELLGEGRPPWRDSQGRWMGTASGWTTQRRGCIGWGAGAGSAPTS